jgi:hypothetical protein
MFTRRVQFACLASIVVVLAAWLFRDKGSTNKPSHPERGHPDQQISNGELSRNSPRDLQIGTDAFRPAFKPTTPSGEANRGGPIALTQCFAAPDFSGQPHPNNRAEWIEWRKAIPFSILLDAESLQRILSNEHSVAFNEQARAAREEDLLNGKNTKLWEWQDDIKAKSKFLSLEQRVGEVLTLLGEPSKTMRYQHRLEGEALISKRTVEKLSLEELTALSEPFSLHYEPEGWDLMPPHHHHLLKLQFDFTADGKLFQWHFDRVPNSPDW